MSVKTKLTPTIRGDYVSDLIISFEDGIPLLVGTRLIRELDVVLSRTLLTQLR